MHHTSLRILALLLISSCVAHASNTNKINCVDNMPTANVDLNMKLNFIFDKITLDQSLRLLGDVAGLSVLRPSSVDWGYIIETRYTKTPWHEILSGICTSQKLWCWINHGVLYAYPKNEPKYWKLASNQCII
ncbi:MAG: hypothetical protein KZQ90_09205 [Candidatus Thiodiazotropha sp. (ex Codakia rugifera)]|nr:hypothetical protein [Candidatus Thiodiazotropha sp. (ex Codakia rugifera)]